MDSRIGFGDLTIEGKEVTVVIPLRQGDIQRCGTSRFSIFDKDAALMKNSERDVDEPLALTSKTK